MWHRSLAWFCLTLLLLGIFSPAAVAQDAPPLPACQPWVPIPQLRSSPGIVRDHILFSESGYPLGQGLIYGGLKSSDRGLSWQQFTNPGNGRVILSPNFENDHTLIVKQWPLVQIYLSTNGGNDWRAITLPQPAPNTLALGDAQHLFAGYGYSLPPPGDPGAVHVSHDGGQTWQRIPTGLNVHRIAVSPDFARDHTLLMSLGAYHYNGGLWKSTDAGLTWTRADAGIDLGGLGIDSIRFSPQFATDHIVFCSNAASYKPTVYKSTDAGANWLLMGDPLLETGGSTSELLLSPRYAQDQTVWLVDYYRSSVSRDGGQTWQPATPYPLWLQAAAEYCLPSGVCGVELFGELEEIGASLQENRYYLYRSYDYGQTWQCLEDPTPPPGGQPPAPPAEIPEPATWLLLAGGAAGLAGWLRRRRTHYVATSRPGAGQWRGAH